MRRSQVLGGLLLLVILSEAHGFEVIGFDATVWPRSDAELGIAGFQIEDFEDVNLVAGLQVELLGAATYNFGPTNTLPAAFDPVVDDPNTASVFDTSVWDGTHALINRDIASTPIPIGYLDFEWGDTRFHFSPAITSFGASLQNTNLTNTSLYINGAFEIDLASLLGTSSGRNGYFRVDAGPAETISTVTIHNSSHSSTSDALAFDHVALGQRPSENLWAADVSGDWNNIANWSTGNVPNTTSETAVYGSVITAPRVVFTETDVTAKGIRFSSPNKYAVTGIGNLTLDDVYDTDARVDVTQGGHEFQLPVSFVDNGTVNVAAVAQVDFNGALNFGGHTITKAGPGTMNVNNGLTQGGGNMLIDGGTVGGFGSVGGSLTANDGGTVAPGTSLGMLTVMDDFNLSAGSKLEIEIGGLLAGEGYDVLRVQGDASLDGILDVAIINEFAPSFGDTFDVVLADSITANGLQLTGDDANFTLSILPGSVLRLTFGGPSLNADFDDDHDVDGVDFLIWQAGFGVDDSGDTDVDGDTDGDDLMAWQAQFGSTLVATGNAESVPEPQSLALALIFCLWDIAARRRVRGA